MGYPSGDDGQYGDASAGSKMVEKGGQSMLETPSYICAAVFAFFLLVSVFLDRTIHAVRHKLEKCSRKGLKTAFDHVIMEMMLLGFISLVLIVFEKDIAGICVKEHTKYNDWVLLSRVEDCHPCLQDTKILSDAYKSEHSCPFWEEKGHSNAYGEEKSKDKVTEHADSTSEDPVSVQSSGHRRKLLAGGGGAVECKEGEEPLVSVEILHETHLFVFLLGIIHISSSGLMILFASIKLRIWRGFSVEEDRHAQCVTHHVREALHPDTSVELGLPETPPETSPEKRDCGVEKTAASRSSSGILVEFENWVAEERDMSSRRNVVREYMICFVKQFIKAVSQEEFSIMRASFMYTHKRTTNFDFMDYITTGLDDDFGQVVKISVVGGLTVTTFILFFAPLNWTSWQLVWVLLAMSSLPLVVETKLVHVVRHVTRGGNVHLLTPDAFWFGKPELLLPVIKYMLFMVSIITTMLAFFAWQFGYKSCFFYGRSSAEGVPGFWTWVVLLIASMGSFLHLCFVTLPTYSLVVHMGRNHWHKDLVPTQVQTTLIGLAKKAKKVANGTIKDSKDSSDSGSSPRDSKPNVQ
ncbi:hypothetical protein BSKO_07665 [Bryopsis sp. KO-2023]|nr:hypothetical protein BSKO_07665 [Bryopsis sp. KO-2023]